MTRLVAAALAALLLAWTPWGTRIAGVDDSAEYVRAEHAYEARQLCALWLTHAADVVVEAGNSGRTAGEIARTLCECEKVSAPFLRLLEGGVGERLDAAKGEAMAKIGGTK